MVEHKETISQSLLDKLTTPLVCIQPPPLFHLPHLPHHPAALLHHVPQFVLHQAAALTPLGQTWSLPPAAASGLEGSLRSDEVDPVTAAAASAYGGSLAQSKVCPPFGGRSPLTPLDFVNISPLSHHLT